MSDVFSEVEEEVRRERYVRWGRQYGPWIIGVVAAALIGVAGWQLYEATTRSSAREQSDQFATAQKLLTDGNAKGAADAFQGLEGEGPAIYRQMAQMSRSAALAEQGDLQGALAGFDAVAESARDPIVRDTARLRAAYLVADTQDFPAVQARVQPLIDGGGAISYLARELLAVEAWEAGQFTLARDTFEIINLAFDAPESMRERAGLAVQVLGPAATGQRAGAAPGAQQQNAAPPTNVPAPARGETK